MTTHKERRLWRIDLNDVRVRDEHHVYEVVMTRGELDGTLHVSVTPPDAAVERLTTALALLRGHVTDGEGWKLINDALWLGARDENDEPIYG